MKKNQKAGFFCARLARNHTSEGKGKEKKKKKKREEEKKKQWLHSDFLYWLPWRVFGLKKCLTEEGYLAVTFFQKSG